MKSFFKKAGKVLGGLINDIMEDSISAYSAQAAFFVIISAFPLIMLLLTLLKFLPYFSGGVPLINIRFFPHDLNLFTQTVLQEIIDNSSNTVLSISAITAIWSSSTGVYSIMLGLTAAYSVKETRGYIQMRLLAIFYTLIFVVMLIAALGVLVFGNSIYQALLKYLPNAADYVPIISRGVRWLLGFGVLVLFFVISYIAVPDRKSTVMEELPGALVSAVGWVGFSYLYAFYIEHFGNYANIYGSLTAVVLLMLWLYFCMFIMLIGAEINQSWKSTYRRILARLYKKTRRKIRTISDGVSGKISEKTLKHVRNKASEMTEAESMEEVEELEEIPGTDSSANHG